MRQPEFCSFAQLIPTTAAAASNVKRRLDARTQSIFAMQAAGQFV
jgi:hypothetical protein